MRDVDPQKVLAWLAILGIAVGWAITGNNLFNRVESLEKWKAELEKAAETRAIEDKRQAEEQRKRDEELTKTLAGIRESVNFANWNIGAINEALKEKKR